MYYEQIISPGTLLGLIALSFIIKTILLRRNQIRNHINMKKSEIWNERIMPSLINIFDKVKTEQVKGDSETARRLLPTIRYTYTFDQHATEEIVKSVRKIKEETEFSTDSILKRGIISDTLPEVRKVLEREISSIGKAHSQIGYFQNYRDRSQNYRLLGNISLGISIAICIILIIIGLFSFSSIFWKHIIMVSFLLCFGHLIFTFFLWALCWLFESKIRVVWEVS